MSFYNDPPVQLSTNADLSQARPDVAVSEYAIYMANVKNRRGAYLNGTFVNSITPYIMTATTDTTGKVVVYATDTATAAGNAVFSMIPTGGVMAIPRGVNSNYQVTGVTVSADLKTVTVTVNQLGSVALGLVSVVSAAAGVPVDIVVWGKSIA